MEVLAVVENPGTDADGKPVTDPRVYKLEKGTLTSDGKPTEARLKAGDNQEPAAGLLERPARQNPPHRPSSRSSSHSVKVAASPEVHEASILGRFLSTMAPSFSSKRTGSPCCNPNRFRTATGRVI